MTRVKLVFGVVILLFAGWYGRLGYSLLAGRSAANRAAVEVAQEARLGEGWLSSLDAALALAERESKPVFVDIWASWCKNCLQMERTTFRNARVVKRLQPYVKVKFRAEDPDAPDVKAVLDHFEVIGLPTYIVLRPKSKSAE